jgi:A/G-specific adenine glycosylase
VELARTLFSEKDVAAFNQGMMDLGALICRPAKPLCDQCPLARICSARAAGDQERFPKPKPRVRRPHYDITAGIIWRSPRSKGDRSKDGSSKSGRSKNDRLLIAQRPLGELLGGLWEFPGGKQEKGETLPECLRREIKEELDIEIRVDQPFMSLDHGYSHFRFTLHAYDCTYLAGTPRKLGCADFRWVRLRDLDIYALPRADRKLAAALNARAAR